LKGQPCELLKYNGTDLQNAQLLCKSPPPVPESEHYAGNRGVNLIVDNYVTSFNNLQTVQPSSSAQRLIYNNTYYGDSSYSPKTIWFRGYLVPGITSVYQFRLETNGDAILMMNEGLNSTGKVNIPFE